MIKDSERGQALLEYWPTIAGAIALVGLFLYFVIVPWTQETYCEVLLPLNGGALPSTHACVEVLDLDCNQGRGNEDDLCYPGSSNTQHTDNDPQDGSRE